MIWTFTLILPHFRPSALNYQTEECSRRQIGSEAMYRSWTVWLDLFRSYLRCWWCVVFCMFCWSLYPKIHRWVQVDFGNLRFWTWGWTPVARSCLAWLRAWIGCEQTCRMGSSSPRNLLHVSTGASKSHLDILFQLHLSFFNYYRHFFQQIDHIFCFGFSFC